MKLLILVPTYNERENIGALLAALRHEVPTADVLVIDDSSPDGTGEIVGRLTKQDKAIHLLSRTEKEGLGKAYVAGLRWSLNGSYTHVATMDADFSHDPKFLPAMIKAAGPKTVVIGSRYVPGGRIEGWGTDRYLLSSVANLVTRTALGLKPKDSSAGFKIYPRAFIESLDLDQMIAAGYAFQVEMLMKAQQHNFAIVEVPITFVDRRAGQSKIAGEATRSIKVVLQLAWQREGLRQFVKFAAVGLINTVVDWSIYFVLNRLLALPKLPSKLGSFVVAAANSYYLNRTWTFRSTNKAVAKEFTKFILVATTGAVLNAGIFWLIVIQGGAADIVGLFFATGLVTVWNFIINKYWTFKPEGRRG